MAQDTNNWWTQFTNVKKDVLYTVQYRCSWTMMFKISTFRDHICSIISTFLFDCCLQVGMRPRGCRVSFPSPPIAQITLTSVQISFSLSEIFFFAVALRPNAGHRLLIFEVF